MPDKPKLTRKDALTEFPNECRLVLESGGWEWFDGNPGSTDEEPVPAEDDDILAAAARWLEGKELTRMGSTTSYRQFMPKDSLRWTLEEVKAQLKRERNRVTPLRGVKVVIHSEKTGEALGYG